MRRIWPEEFNSVLDDAEEVGLDFPATPEEQGAHGEAIHRKALKVRLSQEDYERIWPLAETRYRPGGRFAGKAITLITNNPHYHQWHPADGGVEDRVSESGRHYQVKYVVVHFLLQDVGEDAVAA